MRSHAYNLLRAGALGWGRRQIAALVRDASDGAARVLVEEFGYIVTPPMTGEPKPNVTALQRW